MMGSKGGIISKFAKICFLKIIWKSKKMNYANQQKF